ncbi:MAG: inositol 2-dehydrogenase [Butyricicoccus pullicaecorum]|nr:inositol 2-dehydrogenase [Butyricicoccus pullicaecorum]
MANLRIGVVGCGRIGKLHIDNLINAVPGVEVIAVADPMIDKSGARDWCAARGITNVSADYMDVINNKDVDAVFVCSSTDTHSVISLAAVNAGKHVFCEKPVDYDVDKIKAVMAAVEEKGVKFQVGFNRRFDHNHKAVADAVKSGKIGDPHIVIVSSRDPEPPPASYVAVSGGIFYDMMIHDFDMVRYVTGSEAVEISAVGSCLVNPKLQEESGIPDVDTAVVTMKMANGCIAVINNSRQAVYGYDQRVEVFGSKGMASDGNDLLNTATIMTVDGAHSEKPLWFFLERYNQAFIEQVKYFVDSVVNDKPVVVGAIDGLRPVYMAQAATESCRNGGVYVKVPQ